MTEGMTVQVFTGVDRPVVVKTATTAAARETLRREADRLERAHHPGVVEIMSVSSERLEIAWVGVHTLETAKLPVSAAAAVLAALAETVADLHAMGIVHGRIEPGHVVLTGDGRPVLCGMVGPDPADVTVGPADDVGALGRLMDHLLGPEAEPEPIPERRWGRRTWSGYNRRALQTLADRAAHEDPARRPTARALANAIVETMPEARLQPSRGAAPGNAHTHSDAVGASPIEGDHPDAVPGSSTGEETLLIEEGHTHPSTDADLAISGSGPHPKVDGTERHTIASDPDPDNTELDSVRSETVGSNDLADRSEPDDDWLDSFGARPYLRLPEPARPEPTSVSPPPDRILGLRVEPDPVDDGWRGQTSTTRPTTAVTSKRTATEGRPLDSRRSGLLAGAACFAVLGIIWRMAAPDAGVGSQPAAAERPPAAQPAGQLPSTEEPDLALPDDPAPSTDPTPSEKAESVPPEGSEVTRVVQAGTTYAIGEPGDHVTVADWDCDGTDTPGVVRPTTGEVFLFERWATADEPLVTPPALVVSGASELVSPPDSKACETELRLADGSAMELVGTRDVESGLTSWTATRQAQP